MKTTNTLREVSQMRVGCVYSFSINIVPRAWQGEGGDRFLVPGLPSGDYYLYGGGTEPFVVLAREDGNFLCRTIKQQYTTGGESKEFKMATDTRAKVHLKNGWSGKNIVEVTPLGAAIIG